MAMIAALATPDFHRFKPDLELRNAVGRLAAAMRDARGHAIRTNHEAVVTIDVAARSYAASYQPAWQKLDGDFVLSLYTATVETYGNQVGNIRFFPEGTSTGGRVTLNSGRRHYVVVVDWLTGHVEVIE